MGTVVINQCFGGFGLSEEALNMLEQRGYKVQRAKWGSYLENSIDRHNEDLIEVVTILGEDANGSCARLRVVDFLGNIYRIDEYDGTESLELPDEIDWIIID